MERYEIICSLDGKEPEFTLYGEYADLSKRTFLNDRHAIPTHVDLYQRARKMHWQFEPPAYHIVPVDESSFPAAPGAVSQALVSGSGSGMRRTVRRKLTMS